MTAGWKPLGIEDRSALAEARIQAHHAAQWLARAARAFVPAKPDDSHTSLGWDEAFGGFASHPLRGDMRLGLRLSDLSLAVLDGKPDYFPLDRKRDSDARTWLGGRLAAIGLDPVRLDAPSPYEIPPHAIANNAAYGVAARRPALAELAAWFANANASLDKIRAACEGRFSVSPVRCWPHHFDIATLISLDAGGGEHARSVGAGLSPGDGSYNEPYFYVTPWPYPDAHKLGEAPKPGHWHTEGFTALVLPANRIAGLKNPQEETENFLRAAVTVCLGLPG